MQRRCRSDGRCRRAERRAAGTAAWPSGRRTVAASAGSRRSAPRHRNRTWRDHRPRATSRAASSTAARVYVDDAVVVLAGEEPGAAFEHAHAAPQERRREGDIGRPVEPDEVAIVAGRRGKAEPDMEDAGKARHHRLDSGRGEGSFRFRPSAAGRGVRCRHRAPRVRREGWRRSPPSSRVCAL